MENIFSLRSSGSIDSKLYFLDIIAENTLIMLAVAASQKNIDISCAPYELKAGVCNLVVQMNCRISATDFRNDLPRLPEYSRRLLQAVAPRP